ncbi:type II restriction enzyme [Peptoniphilaceae bacterium SGI.131]
MKNNEKNIRPTISKAWDMIFSALNIRKKIKEDGYFIITANDIKKYGGNVEPRNMAKWDSSELLPKAFKENNVNILPISRGKYIISDFDLYENIPDLTESVLEMQKIDIPNYETISVDNITSESKAINVLLLTKILDNFLEEDDNINTFNGREGTGKFSFFIDRLSREPLKIDVNSAQCEIDAGLENESSIVIIEAKNVVHKDFHIRQLYYPFRSWEKKVNKPIRLLFVVYSNEIYRIFEYEFEEKENYSSIKLINGKNYSLQDTDINMEDLYRVYSETSVKFDDKEDLEKKNRIPFIQADSFDRLISLIENISDKPITELEISELMLFEPRQSNYYFNAGRYLGLLEKKKVFDKGKNRYITKVYATDFTKKILKLKYKERQLMYVKLILEHKIFNEFFIKSYNTGELPEKELVEKRMRELNVCGEKLIDRRSSSVIGWLNWIINLTKI